MPTQSKPRQARRELQLQDKIKLIKAMDSEGKSCRQLAEMFDIGKTQVSTILKRKAEYLDAYEENAPTERKRLKVSSELQGVDDLTWKWFQQARSHSLPVSGPMIQEKARQFALGLDKKDFKASNGWLEKWKIRHNINQATICGESESVDDNVVDEWKKKLPELVAGYDPKDILNMDESGLFYRALPCKTLRVRGDECKGGKKSKDRIKASLCVNLEGDFEQTLIIGKSANPRCFRNLSKRHLPIAWEHNKEGYEQLRTPAATANAFVDDQVRTAEIADDDENKTAEPECEINSNAMALHYASQLRLFCLDRDYGDVLENILKSETSLQERILDSKRNAKQTTLDSFFRH
ncbi:tigger transposable element-derived protein 6-like [Lineus longissimus]|uniref:tigger transposable element-derived protein 6-like n=1 Tax=Lineus longissimus TaxID=88925 RepID=UPI00315D4C7C